MQLIDRASLLNMSETPRFNEHKVRTKGERKTREGASRSKKGKKIQLRNSKVNLGY